MAHAAPLENPAEIHGPAATGNDDRAQGMTSSVTNDMCAANRRGFHPGRYSCPRGSAFFPGSAALCTPTSTTGGAAPDTIAGSSTRAKAATDCPSASTHPGSGPAPPGGTY